MSADAHGNFSGKRLVIFGAGYVGSAMAGAAIESGLEVTALTRNAAKAAALRERGASVVVADLADGGWHGEIRGRADFVLDCVSSGGGGIAGYERSYLQGMKSILAWAGEQGAAGTLVYTSSTSVYPQDGGARVEETSSTDEGGERASLLLAAEDLLRQGATGGVACERWFILRLAGIYGPERHHLLTQVRAGEIGGRDDHRLNLVHRDDICAAIWSAFAAPPGMGNEIFNVADDGAATKAEITSWLATRLGLPAPRFTGEPVAGRQTTTPDRVIANDKLKRKLGWRPRYPSYREGYENLLSR